mmetsp:Transcript_5300/g.15414  ORF Transcript_5300/g.15414 Transcript_5300/m.15414 type:complete len:97 (-) Transcript_5300:132-422(-)
MTDAGNRRKKKKKKKKKSADQEMLSQQITCGTRIIQYAWFNCEPFTGCGLISVDESQVYKGVTKLRFRHGCERCLIRIRETVCGDDFHGRLKINEF